MSIGNRVKELRKATNITQQAFADRLGLKRNTIATYEVGKAEPSDRTISDICREFNVNEIWLRTGEGEMFLQLTQDEEILDYVTSLVKGQHTELQKQIISIMSQLPKELWEAAEMKIEELKAKKEDH